MIVDSSAIMAILRDESDAPRMIAALADAGSSRLSAGSWIELAAVITRTADDFVWSEAERLLALFGVMIEPVTVEHARIGGDAYRRYGRGTAHAAQLNFGDCFAYALAKASGEPLLFKGYDFSSTDVLPA